MGVIFGRPAVNEESARNHYATDKHEWSTELGLSDAAIAIPEAAVDAVVERSAELGAEEEAEPQRDVVEPSYANGLAVLGDPEVRKSGEKEIHEAVDEAHVRGQGLDDDLGAEEAEGAEKGGGDDFCECTVGVVVGCVEVKVVRFFAEPVGFVLEEFRRVGFAEEEKAGNLNQSVGYRNGIESPLER